MVVDEVPVGGPSEANVWLEDHQSTTRLQKVVGNPQLLDYIFSRAKVLKVVGHEDSSEVRSRKHLPQLQPARLHKPDTLKVRRYIPNVRRPTVYSRNMSNEVPTIARNIEDRSLYDFPKPSNNFPPERILSGRIAIGEAMFINTFGYHCHPSLVELLGPGTFTSLRATRASGSAGAGPSTAVPHLLLT
jgi:hypothetical protein